MKCVSWKQNMGLELRKVDTAWEVNRYGSCRCDSGAVVVGGMSQAEHVEYEKEPKSAPKESMEEEKIKIKKARRENLESEIPSCSSIDLFKYKLPQVCNSWPVLKDKEE